jgi:hypothetical protein
MEPVFTAALRSAFSRICRIRNSILGAGIFHLKKNIFVRIFFPDDLAGTGRGRLFK